MKRLNFLLLATVMVALLNADDSKFTYQFGMGIEVFGQHDIDYDKSELYHNHTLLSLSSTMEIFYNFPPYTMLGIGTELQLPRWFISSYVNQSAIYRFTPVYICFSFKTPPRDTYTPELLIHMGYTFFHPSATYKDEYAIKGDVDGGLYLAFGTGFVEKSGFGVSITYRIYRATYMSEYLSMERAGAKKMHITDKQLLCIFSWRF